MPLIFNIVPVRSIHTSSLIMREGRLPISSGGGIREPRLPTGAPGTNDGFLGISGFGDFSRITSILGAAGFSSGAFISGTLGTGWT